VSYTFRITAYTIVADFGCDLRITQFELVLENLNSNHIFKSAIDLQIRLSSKFEDTLKTLLSRCVVKVHLKQSSFGLVSHSRTEFRAAEISTSSRHGFGPIRIFRCPICDPFVLLVSCEY
jgi:hypothetical protein